MNEEHTKNDRETGEEAAAAEEMKSGERAVESAPEESAVEEPSEEAAAEPETEETAEKISEEQPEESAGEPEAGEPVEEPSEEPSEEAEAVEPEAEEPVEEPAEDPAEEPSEEAEAEEPVEEPSEEPSEEAEAVEPEAEEAAEEQAEEPSEEAAAGEPAGQQASEEEKSSRMRWYVVHTYSGRENKVKDTIERMIRNSEMQDQFGKVLVATEEVAEMKKGKKKISQRKLFPSYILIEMEMSDEAWGMIENVPGVTHFVGEGKKPFPIPKKEVDRILGRMVKKEGVVPEVPYTIGEHVKVVDGPFTDFSGIVDEINPERGKLKVLVSIFGRETPVELDFLQVKSL